MKITQPPSIFSTSPPKNSQPPRKFLLPSPTKISQPLPKISQPPLKISQPHSKKCQPQKYVKRYPPPPPTSLFFFFFLSLFLHFLKFRGGLNPLNPPPPLKYALEDNDSSNTDTRATQGHNMNTDIMFTHDRSVLNNIDLDTNYIDSNC